LVVATPGQRKATAVAASALLDRHVAGHAVPQFPQWKFADYSGWSPMIRGMPPSLVVHGRRAGDHQHGRRLAAESLQ
jgi:hypothetical protein